MARETRVDSFSTFLRTVQSDAGVRSPQTTLLQLLKAGPRPISMLVTESQMELTEFLGVLKGLQDLHLVEVTSSTEGEFVSLTQAGKEIAAKIG